MTIFITNQSMGSGELVSILAEAEKAASETQRDSRIDRSIHHQKNLRLLDERIGVLKEQNRQLEDSSWYQFAIGLCSNLLQISGQVLSFVLAPVGAALSSLAHQVAQGTLSGLGQIDPHSKKARELGVDAERAQKKANAEAFRSTLAEEHLKTSEDSARTVQNRLERAITNLQESGEMAVKRR